LPSQLSIPSLHDALPISPSRVQTGYAAVVWNLGARLQFNLQLILLWERLTSDDPGAAYSLLRGSLGRNGRDAVENHRLLRCRRRSEEHTSELQSRVEIVC